MRNVLFNIFLFILYSFKIYKKMMTLFVKNAFYWSLIFVGETPNRFLKANEKCEKSSKPSRDKFQTAFFVFDRSGSALLPIFLNEPLRRRRIECFIEITFER
jgi:hypothetical protein